MKFVKKSLAFLLVICMCFSLAPTALAKEADTQTEAEADPETILPAEDEVSEEDETEKTSEETQDLTLQNQKTKEAAEDENEESTPSQLSIDTVEKQKSVPLNTESLYKIYHLDCGRKYFSVDQIKAIIDLIAENDYNTLELAVGNDGLRFLLDDMSVNANGTTYTSNAVTQGIKEGNREYSDAGTNELSQAEMDIIISYAKEKGISIIPLVNSPGHMDAILYAASEVTGTDCAYDGSSRTIDVTNPQAVNFTLGLLDKYIQYFARKGCTIFNMGCDEYANDIYQSGSLGFGNLVASGEYSYFIDYVNNLAAQVQNAGMTAMAFNDGFYFNGNIGSGEFDTDIAIAFWSSGWSGYKSMSASDLASRGHKIINTNGDWYYILGVSDINNVKANISKTPYNSVMGSGKMDVAGSMLCSWCDKPELTYDNDEAANFSSQISTFAQVNSSVFDVEQKGESAVTNKETVNVSVGGTKTITVNGANYAGQYITDDPSVATVTVTGKDAVESTEKYDKANVTCNNLISSDSSSWKATGYYYTPDNGKNYYPVYAQRSSEYHWNIFGGYNSYTYSWGYSASNSSGNVQSIGTQETRYTNSSPNIDVYTQTVTEASPASTTITFKAVGPAGSSTYVEIGDTGYTINVIQDFSGVEDVDLEYWITNGRPTDESGSNHFTITADLAYSEDGVAVNSIAPENTTKETRTLQYWRSRLLDKTLRNNSTSGYQEQTEQAGDDETYSGVEFTKIRYWNNQWSVYTEDQEWVPIQSKHQLVAYYLEILPISDELMVTAADWGKKGDGSTSGDYLEPSAACTVSVQVVYEDGTTNPASTEASDLNSRTIAYGYWAGGRGVGTLNLNGLEGYQIWKVEAETGSESGTGETWGSYTVNRFTWDHNTKTVYEGDPVDSYVIHNDANNPDRTGYYSNLMWDENYEAILIKVYVKAKPAEENLKVIYYDEKFGDELYAYDINVEDGTDFSDITPKPGVFEDNTDRIDVTGCGITNTLGITQKFETDLTKVPEAVGKYNSELYSYTGSVISEDNRTLYLYYNIDTAVLSPMFVIDYGRPLTFSLSQVVNEPSLVTSVSVNKNTRYGTLTYDESSKMFTYTPDEVLPNIDVLSIHITFDGGGAATTTNAGVMPATTVNYEEGFAELNGFTGGNTGTSNQTAQIAGSSTDNYGYDESVAGEPNNAAVAQQKGSTADISFTGTGIDLYVNSTANSGPVAIQIRDESNKLVKVMSIKTTSNSTITEAFSNTEQNSLVCASVQGLAYGAYTVKITTTSDEAVYFDGFRVYGTLQDQKNDYYVADKEDEPVFLELRDYVLTAMDVETNSSSADVYAQVREETDGQLTGVVLQQKGANNYTAQELLQNGPKNELFLLPGQTVVFKVNTNREVQVGLKAVNGSADVTGSYRGTITTDKDMFYTVAEAAGVPSEKTITISNASNSTSILSVTQVKICDDPDAAFAELKEDDFSDALKELGVIDEPEVIYDDAILNIVLNNKNGKTMASTSLSVSGVAGETLVFDAADIEAAAEELVPDGYELKDTAYTDLEVVCGESKDAIFTVVQKAVEPEKPQSILGMIFNEIKDFFMGLFGR